MGCVGECPANCGSNFVCVGNQPACPANLTSWAETIVSGTTLIKASHLSELESAINAERTHPTRRGAGTSTACGSNSPGAYAFSGARGVGDEVQAAHWTNVAKAINGTPFNVNGNTETPGTIVSDPYVSGGLVQSVSKSDVDGLRAAINNVEGYCICDAYTVLVCGCNGECPTDGDPY